MRVAIVRFIASFRWCFRTFGAKVLGIFIVMERQFHRNESSWNIGTFQGAKVLGTFTLDERKFYRSESFKERMFHGTKVPRE